MEEFIKELGLYNENLTEDEVIELFEYGNVLDC